MRQAVARWWPTTRSVLAWWVCVTLALWLLGEGLGQSAGLAPCAASAGLLVAVGEAGDWLRRRWNARHSSG
ncbi:hypothetical protein [Streptomyces sp. SID12488]|uniref:hypothetical protein n=1 Tax=Streptomyces sp. SID12488 TaxID=2706040 RepID=UPI0013DD10AA|nr:hypothetical protein [Streptomyces sp. SID12488]NEA64969.1 hypothetical protein [Streptomyces sp. SID12488]